MEQDIVNKRQLNPFALPAETDVRFLLLMVAAFLLAFNLGMVLMSAFNLDDYGVVSGASTYPATDAPFEEVLTTGRQAYLADLKRGLFELSLPLGLALAVTRLSERYKHWV